MKLAKITLIVLIITIFCCSYAGAGSVSNPVVEPKKFEDPVFKPAAVEPKKFEDPVFKPAAVEPKKFEDPVFKPAAVEPEEFEDPVFKPTK